MSSKLSLFLLTSLAVAFAPSAWAQFPGDVFFATPSKAVPVNSVGQTDLSLFCGSDALGGYAIRVNYNSAQLDVVDVRVPADSPFSSGFYWRTEGSQIMIVGTNSAATATPIGTVTVAQLFVRPKAGIGVGVISPMSITINETLKTNFTRYASSVGFNGEIVVTPASSTTGTAATTAGDPDQALVVASGDLFNRARGMRPEGSLVSLVQSTGRQIDVITRSASLPKSRD